VGEIQIVWGEELPGSTAAELFKQRKQRCNQFVVERLFVLEGFDQRVRDVIKQTVMLVQLDGRPGGAITAAHRFVRFAVRLDNVFEMLTPMRMLGLVARKDIREVFRK